MQRSSDSGKTLAAFAVLTCPSPLEWHGSQPSRTLWPRRSFATETLPEVKAEYRRMIRLRSSTRSIGSPS